ncbi:unnamed protein product [Spirodela intermedia]|uniref:Uncharacterized protein n=1 Tax=Spirodela intermedia TaxID=51605 RepID=A0A7I8KX10_SPIIN|nr:unnamed protein product [Spirodela intermedia]
MDAQEAYLHEAEDELLATSSSSSSSSDHGWQKVTYPKRQKKIASAKPGTSDPRVNPRNGGASSSVFASVEQKALERRRALELATTDAAAAATAAASRSRTTGRQWGDSNEDDSSEGETATGKDDGAGEVKKVKEKKPKKPKMTVAEAASKIDSEDLASFLLEIGGSYESQQDIQLMRFADYFARSFSAISASQFPWTKIFKEGPVSKNIDVPMSYISESVYKVSADWIGYRSNEALATFVLWSLDNLLVDLVSQQANLKGSKKAVQQSPTKGQVAMFAVLAITLRRKPDTLLSILSTLRDDRKYQGLDKLPVLTWVIGQASQGDPVVGLYAWVHNLLPLLSGKLSGNPQVRDLILQLAERILSGPKARPILLNGAVRKGERLVPPPAIDQLMRLTFVAPSVRVKATERFEAIYPLLKELALAPSGAKAMKQVLLQLLTLSIKAMKENIPELSAEAADVFIWCLTQNSECFKQWEKLHMENIEASLIVLRKLSAEWKHQYAAKFSSHDALRESLKSLREKNHRALAGDVDAGTKAAIKEADKHCKAVLKRITRCSACGVAGGLLAVAVVVAAAALIASPAADSWDWRGLHSVFNSPRSF